MNITTIVATKGKCDLCGVVDELRPYGPNGENVCFDCMMKDEPAAKRQFAKLTETADVVVLGMRDAALKGKQ